MGARIYTEIRIEHKSLEDKRRFEVSLDKQSIRILGKANRSEYVRMIESIDAATGIIEKLKRHYSVSEKNMKGVEDFE